MTASEPEPKTPASTQAAVLEPAAVGRPEPSERVRRWLEGLGCAEVAAEAAVAAMEPEALARLCEHLLGRTGNAVEALQQELQLAGPAGADARRSVLRGFGLVLQELPEDLLEGRYWAEKFDELSEFSCGSFNTLHRYSCNISTTPFPFMEALELLRPMLAEDFGLKPESLCLHAAFFIHYGCSWNTELRRHVDNSLLTVNICLRTAGKLEGCGVRFFGARTLAGSTCTEGGHFTGALSSAGDASAVVDVPPGWALIHWGNHEHETVPWESGERWSAILWFKER